MRMNSCLVLLCASVLLISCKSKDEEAKPEPATAADPAETTDDKGEAEAVKPEAEPVAAAIDAAPEAGDESAELSPEEEKAHEAAETAIKDEKYAEGLKLCMAALEKKQSQRALTACAIAACNLKLSDEAKGFISAVVSEPKKAGLTQICKRLAVAGFE